MADSWQEALGLAAKGTPVALVLPLETGFANDELELVTEQDILGDRLVRRKKRRKDADAFLAELSALTPGDLVVHMEHGIGRYDRPAIDPGGQSPHDCVMLEYARRRQALHPGREHRRAQRAMAATNGRRARPAGRRRLAEAQEPLKERIRAIAHELLKTAALRALRQAPVLAATRPATTSSPTASPGLKPRIRNAPSRTCWNDLAEGKPMDRLVCGDVGFGKTEVALRAAFVAAMAGNRSRSSHQRPCSRASTIPASRSLFRVSAQSWAAIAAGGDKEAKATKAALADGTMDVVIGTHALLSKSLSFKRLGLSSSTRNSASASPTRKR
jgi:transcription-repair coupling factor (superfamily II helicase)